MASDQIIRKLNEHLAAGLTKESDVTYLLVQLGKLTKRAKTDRKYPALTFYRNWVVHERLEKVDWNPEMRGILDRFDALVAHHAENVRKQSQGGGPATDIATLAQQLKDIISLGKLEDEINQVFGSDQHLKQTKFRRLLLGILADISLEAPGYKHLEGLKVKEDGQFNTLVLSDRSGQTFDISLT
jgi:hypothetical protein